VNGRGEVITFYSYKGGTGRTMALANAAVLLSQRRSRRVLAMDWDLEAPGLHRFFDHPAWSAERPRPGTVNLLYELAHHVTARRAPLGEEETRELVAEVRLADYTVEVQPGLDVIWAGPAHDESYAQAVSQFDWDDLYARAPFLFTAFAERLAEGFGHVLIDSRTGLSDTSGICTAVFPEKLVVVFTPNRQSLEGALHRARAAVTYRSQSDDLRPLLVYPLASRVELSEDELRHEWRHSENGYQPSFERLLKKLYGLKECDLQTWFDDVQIQYATRYSYGEDIAVEEERSTTDRLSLARSYAGFTRALEESDAPWTVERQPDTRREANAEQESAALERLEEQLGWHAARAGRGRRMLLVIRLYQAVVVIGAVVAAAVLQVDSSEANDGLSWFVLIGGGLVAAGLEGAGTFMGATQWRWYANVASALDSERSRYRTRTRGYGEVDSPATLLAERTDEILERAAEQRGDRFGLGPPPGRF
jgi:cellulose biosynthesis protein BcsQ